MKAPLASRRNTPEVVLLAAEAADRARLAEGLGSELASRDATPRELRGGSGIFDAAVLLALVRAKAAQIDIAALVSLRAHVPRHPLVLVTDALDDADLERALERLDACTWLPDPPPAAALRRAVRRALEALPTGEGARRNQRRAPALLGTSAAIRAMLDKIRRIAVSEMPVLILGETGTGKELVARAIHDQSRRATGPFVALNCSALPDALLESELFGFVRGAFTGADRGRAGVFEQAEGGTLFLDEIGDTAPVMQTKLLRVLQEKVVRPLGGDGERSVDVRVVSATNRDLEAAAAGGEFRQDLLYRLNAATIDVPPLRRRRVDIPFLAQHFAEEFGEANARRITLGEDFIEAVTGHGFPGNVRELRNAVERAIALTLPGEDVSALHLQLAGSGTPPPDPSAAPGTLRERVEQLETQLIRDALRRLDDNRTRVAEALGLSRLGLRQKMRRLGLETEGRS